MSISMGLTLPRKKGKCIGHNFVKLERQLVGVELLRHKGNNYDRNAIILNVLPKTLIFLSQ